MAVQGKGTNPKTTLYVGGLEESVNESTLHAAFIPFGDIKDVNIPIDHASGKHRCVFYSTAGRKAGSHQNRAVPCDRGSLPLPPACVRQPTLHGALMMI